MKRFELSTLSLARRCSTTELHPQVEEGLNPQQDKHALRRAHRSSDLTKVLKTAGTTGLKVDWVDQGETGRNRRRQEHRVKMPMKTSRNMGNDGKVVRE